MKTLIIQTSPPHTASTFLVNALHGIIPSLYKKRILYEIFDETLSIIVVKSHILDIDNLIEKYGKKYKLYFICSERKEKNLFIDEKYKNYSNVLVFEYSELNETVDNDLVTIVENIYNKVKKLINYLPLNKSNCLKRIIEMNKRYEEIKTKPWDYVDDFYELHGSHRNRN
jgi:hypothetical protein